MGVCTEFSLIRNLICEIRIVIILPKLIAEVNCVGDNRSVCHELIANNMSPSFHKLHICKH